MLATATAFVSAYHAPLPRRTDVRMSASATVTSWYDAGTRLAAFDGVVMLTTKTKAAAPTAETKAALLQRYLQLRAVLPEAAPLPDNVVEALIVETEEEAAATVEVDGRLDGEWRQVWQRTAKEGTASQKALSPVSQKLYQNFIVDSDGCTARRSSRIWPSSSTSMLSELSLSCSANTFLRSSSVISCLLSFKSVTEPEFPMALYGQRAQLFAFSTISLLGRVFRREIIKSSFWFGLCCI